MPNGPETGPGPEMESESDFPVVNWSKAAESARLGDYKPADWVRNFKEKPELTNIPEPANPRDVLLVHWRDRMRNERRLDVLMSLPSKGEISTSLMTKNKAIGGPIGVILEPDQGAITEMHVTDVNSTPGHKGMPEGKRKGANPSDKRILRQLEAAGRLTPEQVAVIQINGGNEVFVESSRIKRVVGIIYNSFSAEINPEIRRQAEDRKIPIFEIREEKAVRII